MAMKDPQARDGLRTGSVTRSWAKKHHPQWVAANTPTPTPTPTPTRLSQELGKSDTTPPD